MPALARLGCDDGWLSLSPYFLNFRTPVLLVDQQIVGWPQRLGLEPFGDRDPSRSLPTSTIRTSISGGGVALYARSRTGQALLAAHWFDDHEAPIHRWPSTRTIVLIVGDSRAVQLSWSAIWTCWIGRARQLRPSVMNGNLPELTCDY
jgi:hypothetical protein